MLRIVKAIIVMVVLAGSLFPAAVYAESARPETVADPPLELIRTIGVGGMPDSIIVDTWSGRNDVLFYDLSSSKVKFLDGASLQTTSDEIYLPHRGFDSWMSYDRTLGHTYVLQVQREFDWDNLMVSVLNRRSLVSSFSVNEEFNANKRVDFPYDVTGMVSKPALLETNLSGRIVVNNGHGGRLDIVDMDLAGLEPRNVYRHTYRQPINTQVYRSFLGSSVALEPRYETTLNTLADSDLVYLMDGNTSDKRIRTFEVWHGKVNPTVVERGLIDFTGMWPFSNGVQGLFVNGPADQLLIGTALQSFDEGYAASVRTTGTTVETLHFMYADSGFVHADWHDPMRVFVTTFDDFWNDSKAALRLRLLYGSETFSLILESGLTKFPSVRDMMFDPYHRRLYITSDDKIYVVKVNVGAPSPPLPRPRPAAGSVTLFSPWYGGMLQVPDDRATVNFLPNSVSAETKVVYAETPQAPSLNSKIAVRAFQLRATATDSGKPVTSFPKPYQLTLKYKDTELGPVDEASCGLYWWNGTRWVPESAATVDRNKNEVTVSLDHMSMFAILGEPKEKVFLPATIR